MCPRYRRLPKTKFNRFMAIKRIKGGWWVVSKVNGGFVHLAHLRRKVSKVSKVNGGVVHLARPKGWVMDG